MTATTPIAALVEGLLAKGVSHAAIVGAVEAVESQGEKRTRALTVGSARGTRLPSDWQPSSTDLAYATAPGRFSEARAAHEAEKFRNYWTAKTGAGATKRDWPATWRNWILNSLERSHGGPGNNRTSPVARRTATGADAVIAGMGNLARRLAENRNAAGPANAEMAQRTDPAGQLDFGPSTT